MYINVVIPTCPLHIKYIRSALDSVHTQTRHADRIICVLNEYTRHQNRYQTIEQLYPQVIFVKSETWNVAGVNRALGTQYVVDHPLPLLPSPTLAIISYHDVDDIMFPNKLAHLEYYFKKYKCDLLVHQIDYDWEKKVWEDKNVKSVKVIKKHHIENKLREYTYNLDITNDSPDKYEPKYNVRWSLIFGQIRKKTKSSRVHHGLVSVNTRIFKNGNIYWTDKPTGQDVLFVNEVNRQFNNSLIVQHAYCKVVGKEHIRKYGNKIYRSKYGKILDYKPIESYDTQDSEKTEKTEKTENTKHEGFDFDFRQYLKKSVI